jgi:hypothetical protein
MYNKNPLTDHMKKLISFLAALIIFAIPFSYINADDEVNFLEALSNTYELESYTILQGIYGDFKIKNYGNLIDGNFRLSFSGNVNSDEAYENNNRSRVNGYLRINYHEGEDGSFDQLTVNLSGEIVSIFGDGIYMRLNDLRINTMGMEPVHIEDINESLAEINQFKNQWYRIPIENLTGNANEEVGYEFGEGFLEELIDPETLVEYFQGNDIKTAIGEILKNIATEIKEQGDMTDEEYNWAMDVIDLIIETKFFNQRNIVSGRNIGFKFFSFSKSAVINLVQDLAEILGETFESYELAELRETLGKFNLAGIYRINSEYDLIDNLLIKLTLRNIDELEEFHLKYRYKISNFNDAPQISAPTDYMGIEETEIYIPYVNN